LSNTFTPGSFKTTCCYCGVGCGIVLQQDERGGLSLKGDPDHPVNKGKLCSKGMNLHHTVLDQNDRLLYPTIRYGKGQPMQQVSWDNAIGRTAAVFRSIIDRYGPDAVGFYASGQCLTEEYYVLNKLVKGFIGTNNIDTNSRLCMSSAVAGYKASFGADCVPCNYDDIEKADCIFVAGANPAWCHPILWRRVEAAKLANPSLKIIVSDPRQTQSTALADLHFQIHPGTDITLHYAIARCLIEDEKADAAFLKNATTGFAELCTQVFKKSVGESASICGIDESDIRKTAAIIGSANAFLSMWTMGLNQSINGVQNNTSLINLHLITGQIGKPGSGPLSLTGQPNAMGGREVGALSNLLPAHRDLLNAEHRRDVAAFWRGCDISPRAGLTATEMFEALEDGSLKAIWIICTNPLLSLPDVRRAEHALSKARFVVVQDISNKPETLRYADVVLPAAGWTEKEGTMTNAERRITHLTKLRDAPGEALPDAEIICRFARAMGFPGFDFVNAEAIFREHATLTSGTHMDISCLDYSKLNESGGVQWPIPTKVVEERLFSDHQFFTIGGKARIIIGDDHDLRSEFDPHFPLILTTGRTRDQWHTMTKTGKVGKLKNHLPEPLVELHPCDAGNRHIHDGDLVMVESAQGQLRMKARITTELKPGVLFVPMHWGKILGNDHLRVNNVTSSAADPLSKQPGFKYTRVEVSRYIKPAQRIIIIGGGAGAYGFINRYQQLNEDDELIVFSDEDLPFYNRVLLPEYVVGATPWNGLLKRYPNTDRLRVHKGVRIIAINRFHKTVTDSNGQTHSYDLLVMATGSRSAQLRHLPAMNGIFTMRNRKDADHFTSFADKNPGRVVIIGGGLLGIELAAALREQGKEITIIQRISKLMDRQLDDLSSLLLHEVLCEKGIQIIYNAEVDRCLGATQIQGVQLRSGLKIDCSAMIIAIGTVPNKELATEAGLACNRGVIVNSYLQTSDLSIYAIGELAEFNGMLYGNTASAEQQASVVASHLSGSVVPVYEGSVFMNILKMHNASFCSLGITEAPDASYEEIIFIDRVKRYYKKCIVHNDRLVGAILVGDKNEFLEFRDLIEQKLELGQKRMELLRSGQAQEPVKGRLICTCANVGEGNLTDKIENGCRDMVQLCQLTGAGSGCGSCKSEVAKLLEVNDRKKIQNKKVLVND
jgi:ferredoxin-nitrate reductase